MASIKSACKIQNTSINHEFSKLTTTKKKHLHIHTYLLTEYFQK